MAHLDSWIKALDECHWEYSLALENLDDDKVWRRPDPRLLSIGELTAHVTYAQAIRLCGGHHKMDLAQLPISGPFIDHQFGYYLNQVDKPVALKMNAEQLRQEFKRVHEESKVVLREINPHEDDKVDVGGEEWTWGYQLRYIIFHISYHAGQAYSVRHLLGDTPEDN